MAAVRPHPTLNEKDLDQLLEQHPDALLLALDQVTDPHNLGACIRTAAAMGVEAVVVSRDRSASLTPTARKVAAGGAEKVKFIQVTNLARTMKQLQSRGIWIFGTSDKGDRGLYETDFTGPAALVMGAEGEGMRRLTEENCDFLLRIPMKGSIPCLNVSVATGVCLYEMVRQRS